MSMRPESWVEEVLASPAQIRIVRVLARVPEKSWTEREVAREAGLPPSTANVAFRRLEKTGVIEVRHVGRSHLVRLAGHYEVSRYLVDFFRREAMTLQGSLDAAQARLPDDVAFYLFGSTARGQATADSDVDLLIVGPNRERTEEAVAQAYPELRRFLPARFELISLDRRSARRPRYRSLLENVRRDGRRLSRLTLDEVLA